MNIVILAGQYYPSSPSQAWNLGQVTKIGLYLASEWKKAGHNVIVIKFHEAHILRSGGGFFHSERYETEGISICYIHYPRYIPRSRKVLRITAKGVMRAAKQFIAESGMGQHVDLFYCDFPVDYAGIISHFKRDRLFRDSRFVPVFNDCDLSSLEQAKAVIADAEVIGARSESLKKRLLAVDPSANVFLALSGAPEISDKRVGQKVSMGARPKKFLFAAALIPRKNADILLQSFAKVRQTHQDIALTIVGDGPERARLAALTEALDLRDCVTFTGAVSRQSVLEYMLESDVFVMVSHLETFGLVYVEALGAGCYVIGASGEGIDGVIKDGVNGSLVEPRNVDALADKMLWYLERSDEERRRLLANSYQTAQMYTEKQVAKNVLDDIDAAFRRIE